MILAFRLFPESASTVSRGVDLLYLYQALVALLFAGVTFALIFYFALRYRRRSEKDQPPPTKTVWKLELAWIVLPTVFMIPMFVWGATLFAANKRVPEGAVVVDVIGKQWMWKITHPEGPQEINNLHVPVGTPIRLRMISEDVIHSFFIPAFRVKQDVLPGRYSTMWFEATKPGRYHLFCAEYCGTEHSRMGGFVYVMEPREYQEWLEGGPRKPPAQAGKELFDRLGCASCHGEDAVQRAPPWEGLFGSRRELADGRAVIADSDYLRESILDPQAKVVKGYEPNMPSYKGQLDEEQILQLIAYMKTLSDAEGG